MTADGRSTPSAQPASRKDRAALGLLAWPGPRLAGWVGKVLDVEGKTAEARRAEVMRDMTSAPDDANELFLRHVTRSVTWFVLLGVVFPPSLLGVVVASVLLDGRDGAPLQAIVFVSSLISFFVFFMACLHLLKAMVSTYLLEERWDLGSRGWRAVMLAQGPDIMLALTLATLVALSLR